MAEESAKTAISAAFGGTGEDEARPIAVTLTSDLDRQLIERVLRVVATNQKVAPERVTIESTFEQLRMDSLDGVNLVFAIEEEFDIAIPDDAAKSIRTVRQMAEGVESLLRGK